MTIKELEERTGLARANIRFYESEGLISPKRLDNGYRDYSEGDAVTLEKIKLLRELHLDIDTIRLVQNGELTLERALFSLRSRLEGDKVQLDRAVEVCRELEQSGAEYDTLEPKTWLGRLEAPQYPRIAKPAQPVPKEEEPMDYAHGCFWRRWLARMVDASFHSLPVFAVAMLVFHWNPSRTTGVAEWFVSLLGLMLTLLCEPFWLHFWGWTPGKYILGLKVRGERDGRKLTFGEGFWRAGGVFLSGYGLSIPIVNIYCAWKFWKRCINEEPAPWDEDITYTVEARRLEWLMVLGTAAVWFGLAVLLVLQAYLPPNRGALTERKYYENINFYMEWMTDSGARLTETGEWYDASETPTLWVLHDRPDIQVEMKNGEICRVTLTSAGTEWGKYLQQDYGFYQIALIALLAQEKISPVSYNEWSALFEDQWDDFKTERDGVHIVQTVEFTGYTGVGQLLRPGTGVAQSYSKTVTITLTGSD